MDETIEQRPWPSSRAPVSSPVGHAARARARLLPSGSSSTASQIGERTHTRYESRHTDRQHTWKTAALTSSSALSRSNSSSKHRPKHSALPPQNTRIRPETFGGSLLAALTCVGGPRSLTPSGTHAHADPGLRNQLIKLFSARLADAEARGQLASERVAQELPWLLAEAGDIAGLKKVLVSPAVFPRLYTMYKRQHNYDIFRWWDRAGTTDAELMLGLARHLDQVLRSKYDPQSAAIEAADEYRVLGDCGRFLEDAGLFEESIKVQDLMLLLSPPGASEAGVIYMNKGTNYYRLGRGDEALATLELAREAWAAQSGPDSLSVAEVFNNIGLVHMDRVMAGGPDRAASIAAGEEAFRKCLTIYERVNHEKSEVLGTKQNIGILCKLQGRLDEAHAIYLEVLAYREDLYGRRHPKVSESLNALGSLALARSQLEEARGYFQRALDISIEFYGENHFTLGTMHYNLGLIGTNTEDWKSAAHHYSRARDLYRDSKGPLHMATMDAYRETALAQLQLGQYDDSAVNYTASIKACRAVRGEGSTGLANHLFNVAKAFAYMKNDQSPILFHESCSIFLEQLGLAHPTTLTALLTAMQSHESTLAEAGGSGFLTPHHGHGLQRAAVGPATASGSPNHSCDQCKGPIAFGLPMYRCTACDYDLCSPCRKEAADPDAIHEHPLAPMVCARMATAYKPACDVCGTPQGWCVYTCVACGFDLCPFCFLLPKAAPAGSAAP
eukprot:m.160921 g.160921  ORF g.160921 m.160921 type:complete len:728 (-) comp9854_c0_seq7:128-2311(-)